MTIPMQIVVKGVGDIFTAVKGMNILKNSTKKVRDTVDKSSTSYKEAFKSAEKFTYIDNIFGSLTNKIDSFAKKQRIFSVVGGRVGIIGNQLMKMGNSIITLTDSTNGLGKAMKMFGGQMMAASMEGKGFFGSMFAGFKAVKAAILSGTITLGGLAKGFLALGVAVAKALWPITLVAAAIYSLKKIWDINLGGIQTKFNQVIGEFRVAWARFNIFFIQTLRKFEPVFNFIFGQMFNIVRSTFSLIVNIFKGLYSAVEPVIDVFAEIFSLFGDGKSDFNIVASTLKLLGNILLGLGKVIGFVIRIALTPMMLMIRGLKDAWDMFVTAFKSSAMFNFLMKLKDVFMGTFDTIKNSMQSIWDFVLSIINRIPDRFLPSSLKELKKAGVSSDVAPGVTASSPSANNNVNNNQQITFHTSTPTSPDQSRAFAQKLQQQFASGF